MEVQFAQERERKTATVEDMMEALNTEFNLERGKSNLKEVSFTPEGKIKVGGDDFIPTKRAFKSLLGTLHIPPRFALGIPEDLLDTIIRRLRDIEPKEIGLFHREGVLYNMVSGRYSPPALQTLVQETVTTGDDLALGFVGTTGVHFAAVSKVKTAVAKGDIVHVGLYFNGSHTGRPAGLCSLMTYRLICTNGAIGHRADWGEIAWPRKGENKLETYRAGIAQLRERYQEMSDVLKLTAARSLTDIEFAKLWKRVRQAVGDKRADELFEVEEKGRAQIMAVARVKYKTKEEAAALPGASAYTAFNNITAAAHGLLSTEREQLMAIGGRLLR